MKKKKIIIIFIVLLLIFSGLWVIFSSRKPEEIAVTFSPLPDIELNASTLKIGSNVFPIWLNTTEIIFPNTNQIVSLNIRELEKAPRDLFKLDKILTSMTAGENTIVVQTGSPFSNLKTYQIYKNGKLSTVDLKNYEPVNSLSINTDTEKISFIGNYDVNTSSGKLYLYDLNTQKIEGPVFTNISYGNIQWVNNNSAIVYSFLDTENGETISYLNLEDKSIKPISSNNIKMSMLAISPDKTKVLISGPKYLLLKYPDYPKLDSSLKNESFTGSFIDDENALITLTNSPIDFILLNVNSQQEKKVETPDTIKGKFIQNIFPSPDYKNLLMKTQDNKWILLGITKK